MTKANSCRVVSLNYPGALELCRQHLSSPLDTADLPLETTSFIEPISSIPSTDEIVVLIHKNILNTVFPAAMTLECTGRVEQSQERFESATIFCLLYRSIDNNFTYLNLFIHNTGEIYPNLGIIRHIRKYRSRETRMRQTEVEVILPLAVDSRNTVNDVDRVNHVTFKDDDDSAVFSSFRSRLADRHYAWQQIRNNFGFTKSNVSSEL